MNILKRFILIILVVGALIPAVHIHVNEIGETDTCQIYQVSQTMASESNRRLLDTVPFHCFDIELETALGISQKNSTGHSSRAPPQVS